MGVLRHTLLTIVVATVLAACGQATSAQPTAPAGAPTQAASTSAPKRATATPRPKATATALPASKATSAPKRATATPRPKATATALPASKSGLEQVAIGELPLEAKHTLDLINQGGPFPYDRDGVTFQNREQVLPKKAQGYYHEYTVPTPGEDDRGARRLITGKQGEIYYTADHYVSFVEVVP